MTKKYPKKPAQVYFFATCLINMSYPEAGMAGIKLIEREGVNVIYPRKQSCCGQPAYNSGFADEARDVARQQLKQFHKDYPIIVPSGSCAGMMKHHYPKLFADSPEYEEVVRFSNKIFELTEFLVHVLDICLIDKGEPTTITWHSSCHANREMHVIKDSKSLLKQLDNVTLKEIEREYDCCGFGGTFSIKQSELSGAMVNDKLDDIVQTGAKKVVSGDCGCLVNITGAAEHRNMDIKGQHIADFIWGRING